MSEPKNKKGDSMRKQIDMIKHDFARAQPLLNVIGDETRQLILIVLMETSCKEGMRVGEITTKTHLSRPAVSHQIKILKDLGIVKCRNEGTMNFYYIDVSHNKELFSYMKKLVLDIEKLMDIIEIEHSMREKE